jgi:hypothetical protein
LEDIKFSNILVHHQGGGSAQDTTIAVPEIEKVYPDPNRFGPMPANGFFIRHVKGISMRDVEVKYAKEDLRPAMVLEDVQHADFVHVKLQHAPNVPMFSLKNVEDFEIYQTRPLTDTHLDKVQQQTL